MKKRRLLSMILTICMVLSLVPMIANASEVIINGAPVQVTTVDHSVDNSSIRVDLYVILRNGETGDEEAPYNIDTITPESVTVSTFDTVKANAINQATAKFDAWLQLTRQMNPEIQFTVVGDRVVAGDAVPFDNRTYTMRNNETGSGSGSGTTSRYMEINGDYGKTGTYSVTMTVEIQTAASAHTHTLTPVSANAATCTEAGNIAYYTCECGKWFADAAGTTEITDHSSVVIPAAGHTASDWTSDGDNHWKVCAVCAAEIADSKAAHSYGDDNVCDVCGYTKPSYSFLEGANGIWTQGNGTLTFRASGDFSKFTGVKIDGTLIDAENYTAVSGSTIVTLNADYLAALSAGTHTLTVVYTDGACSTDFEVGASQAAVPSNPVTGDNSMIWLWTALLVVSGICIVELLVYSRKSRMSR